MDQKKSRTFFRNVATVPVQQEMQAPGKVAKGENLPRWSREILRYLPLKPQFVLTGNIRDQHPIELLPGRVSLLPLISNVGALLKDVGYGHFIRFDPVHGFSLPSIVGVDAKTEGTFFGERLKLEFNADGRSPATINRFFELLECFVDLTEEPVALFVDFSSRFLLRPDHPNESENQSFTRALILSHETSPRPCGSKKVPFYNTVIWLAEKEGDLPDWFTVGNPKVRHITVPKPDHVGRRGIGASLLKGITDGPRRKRF